MGLSSFLVPPNGAETYFRESLRICEDAGDKRGATFVANNIANLAMNQGAWEVARTVFEDNLHRFRDLHDDEGVAWTSTNLAVAVRETDPRRPISCSRKVSLSPMTWGIGS